MLLSLVISYGVSVLEVCCRTSQVAVGEFRGRGRAEISLLVLSLYAFSLCAVLLVGVYLACLIECFV